MKNDAPIKLPKLLNKTYTEKQFKAKLLKHIASNGDKKTLYALYEKEEQTYTPITPPTVDKKRIKQLAKTIKTNRKRVRKGRLICLLVVLAILVGGTLLFKNRVTEQALEKGMGMALQTEVDLSGVQLKIFKNTITYDGIEVVDPDKPSHHMVVVGEGSIQVDVAQLLQSRIIIPEIIASGIAWDVPREGYTADTPEELPEEPEQKEKPQLDIFKDPVEELLSIYEEAKSNLVTPPLVTTLQDEYAREQQNFEDRITRVEEQFSSLSTRVEEVSKWNKEYFIKNPTKLPTAKATIEEIFADAQMLLTEAKTLQQEIEVAANKIPADKLRIEEAMERDRAYLEENYLITNFSTQEIIAMLGETFLTETMNEYLVSGTKVLNIVKKITPSKKEKEQKPSREGRIVEVGTKYPAFALGKLVIQYADESTSLEVRDISTNPTIWGATPSGDYQQLSEDGDLAFSFASLVAGTSASFLKTQTPLSVDLQSLGIENLSGLLDLDFSINTETKTTQGVVELYNHAILTPSEASPIVTAIVDVIQSQESISWNYLQEGENTTVTSSLDAPLKDSLDSFVANLKTQGKEFLQEKLQGDIAEPLSSLSESLGSLESWKAKGEDILTQIEEAKVLLEEKKAEIEGYLKSGLLENLPSLPGGSDSLPSLPGGSDSLPSLPSGGGSNKGGGLFSGFGG